MSLFSDITTKGIEDDIDKELDKYKESLAKVEESDRKTLDIIYTRYFLKGAIQALENLKNNLSY